MACCVTSTISVTIGLFIAHFCYFQGTGESGSYHVSKLVHLEGESEVIRVFVVSIDVLFVGLPDDVALELFFITTISPVVLL